VCGPGAALPLELGAPQRRRQPDVDLPVDEQYRTHRISAGDDRLAVALRVTLLTRSPPLIVYSMSGALPTPADDAVCRGARL
jgi:hypothetical protein